MPARIWVAHTAEEIARCLPVIRELRPHLDDEIAFIKRIQRQQRHGYRLAALEVGEQVRAVVGFRISESLARGRHIYVDDLVVSAADRSKGAGKRLFEWLLVEARDNSCTQIHLDSEVKHHDTHRFFLARKMEITSHHFALKL